VLAARQDNVWEPFACALFDPLKEVIIIIQGSAMKKIDTASISLTEPAIYRINIFGKLDKNWSDYCGGMTIENESDAQHRARTILTGRLPDQSALIGVLTSLYDIGCPIISVECIGT
jgi:hypothetical protein